jgi:hypothetical protein
MHRRRFLGWCAAGALGAIAGCSSNGDNDGDGDGDGGGGTPTNEAAGQLRPRQPRQPLDDVDLPVPRDELDWRLAQDSIPAVVEPSFAADWSGLATDDPDVDTSLDEGAPVIGVTRGGNARAYPLRVLDRHEIVNDTFGGPLAVTYCVLCGSAVVVERTVAGEPTVFGVSGALWRNDLVMYDEATESLWSQILATAIRGDRTGDQLQLVPSSLTTWGEWREQHPGTAILLPPPRSNTVRGPDQPYDYFSPKYSYGDEDQLVGFDSTDGGLQRRTLVVGVATDDAVRAYPFPVVAAADVVNDEVGDRPVVVTVAPDGTLAAYDRRVGGERLSFAGADERTLTAGGSRWERTTGRALDGPHEGDRLDRANDHPPMFWLGWSKFNPDTGVYGIDGGPDAAGSSGSDAD